MTRQATPRGKPSTAAALLTTFAALLLAAACALPAHALADEAGGDTPQPPQIIGSFDKERYEAGEQAVVTFSVANNTPVTWNSVRLEALLPSGVRLLGPDGTMARETETLAPGETLELRLAVSFDSTLFRRLAPTGDGGLGGLALACAAAAGFVALAAGSLSRKRERSRAAQGGMGALMSIVLVVGLAPFIPGVAHADEDAAPTAFALEGSATCEQLGIAVPAALTVGSTDQAALTLATVEVVNGAAIPANAQHAQINVVSDVPFAEGLSADTIALGGDFEGLSVASVKPAGTAKTLNDTEGSALALTLEGTSGAPGARGVVLFGAGSFIDADAQGEATVAVEEAQIAFDIQAGSYDNATTFTIPVSLENGRFSLDGQAAHFVFADQTLTASSFTVNEDDPAKGTLEVAASAATPLEQFNALSAALDADDQLVINPAAIVGEAPVVIVHAAYNDGNDHTVDTITTTEAAAAVPYGTVQATGVTSHDDHSLTVHSTVAFGALNGSVNITDTNLINNSQISLPGQTPSLPEDYGDGTSDGGGMLENNSGAVTFTEVRSDGFDFDFTIGADTVESWYKAYTESGLAQEEANRQFLDEMNLLMRGHEVDLAAGAVLNKFGIAQGECAINLSDPSLANMVNDRQLYDQEDDMRTAKQVFEVLEKLVSAISYFCSSDPSNIGQGISQILGIIASLLETGPNYTIQDVLDELNQMKGQLARLETSVDNLAIQLRAIDKRGGFESDWYQVKWLMDHLNSYGTLYMATIGNMSQDALGNDGIDAKTFADLTEANKATLATYQAAVDAKNGLLNTTVYADTMNLGSMIVGTGTKDVVSDYYNWIETYYNWDPETFEIKDVYLGSMLTAYLYGYLSSMAYLSTIEGTGTEAEQITAKTSKDDLAKQADQVLRKLVGQQERVWDRDSMTYKNMFQKSPLRKATEPLPKKQIRCLINDHVYSLDNHTGALTGRLYDEAYFGGASFGKSVDREDVVMYTFTGELNLAQWQQMVANLPQVRQIKYSQKPYSDYSLNMTEVENPFAEMSKLGFTMLAKRTSDKSTGSYPKGHPTPLVQWKYEGVPPSRVVVGDASYSKVSDQLAVRHVRMVTVDVFDIKANKVLRGVTAGRHESVYWVGYGWGYLHDLWPYCTTEARYESRELV